jgi:hypothetical protein
MPPDAKVLPSGLYATEFNAPVCPLSVALSLPVDASQSLMVLSMLPTATSRPSGLNATVCGSRVSSVVVKCSINPRSCSGKGTGPAGPLEKAGHKAQCEQAVAAHTHPSSFAFITWRRCNGLDPTGFGINPNPYKSVCPGHCLPSCGRPHNVTEPSVRLAAAKYRPSGLKTT